MCGYNICFCACACADLRGDVCFVFCMVLFLRMFFFGVCCLCIGVGMSVGVCLSCVFERVVCLSVLCVMFVRFAFCGERWSMFGDDGVCA